MELASQGEFEVHVYEAGPALGGKARSQVKTGTGAGGRADLPGEHGFRFFPAFYRHVIDTMRRIPAGAGRTVEDHLVPCDQMAMAEPWRAPSLLPRRRPETVAELLGAASAGLRFLHGSGIDPADLARFGASMLALLCACDERRFGVHEDVSFWELVQGDRYGERFQRYLNASRFMVAMDARRGSARTIAAKALQIVRDYGRADGLTDRVLDGPTNERWIDPWEAHLRGLGVGFHLGRPLLGLEAHPTANRLTGARVGGPGAALVEADHYVLCVPIERVRSCLGRVAERDPLLRRLVAAPPMTAWMVGAQFYLRREIPVCAGHVAYPDSPWALSSISQAQFWRRAGGPPFAARYGDGEARDILSVDICEWHRPGRRTTRSAAQCTSADEVLHEVWRQLQDGLNGGPTPLLRDEDRVSSRLDSGVSFGPHGAVNDSPLLVHPPGSWWNRPEATTAIENLTLAADYVRTTTDLATMEGANEAARLAVNAIFAREGLAARAALFPSSDDAGPLLALARRLDRRRWLLERRAPSRGAGIGRGPAEDAWGRGVAWPRQVEVAP
jgi:uncharacterized protein with NAD-binding domain and iron-sulfur cluster